MEQLNPQGVMSFKSNIEQHVQYMSGYINSIEMRVRAMEHNHADMTKFYQWLEQTHPDIINAYKSVTTVNKRFDDADKKEEMIYPQTASAA
jgi:hypothetical protein